MTQRDFDILRLQRPRMDDLAVNQYGDRVYGTPEETLWNDALARAQARIANPRWMAEGVSYDGAQGNIDSPDIVNEELFSPLQEAFHPLQAMENDPKAMTPLDMSLMSSRRAQEGLAERQFALAEKKQKWDEFEDQQRLAQADKKLLNDFNLRSSNVDQRATRAREFAIKGRIEMAMEEIRRAKRSQNVEAEAAAMAELEKWENQLTSQPERQFSTSMPTFEAEPTRTFTPTPAPVAQAPAATPMPRSKAQLVKGQTYLTPRGIATWDGNQFVK